MSGPTESSTDLRHLAGRYIAQPTGYQPYIAIFGEYEPETPEETKGDQS